MAGGRLAEPGGQRVLMLGGIAVGEWGGVVGVVGAATAAAPSSSPDIVTYRYFMSVHHIGGASLGLWLASSKLDPVSCCFRAPFHSSTCIGDAMLIQHDMM